MGGVCRKGAKAVLTLLGPPKKTEKRKKKKRGEAGALQIEGGCGASHLKFGKRRRKKSRTNRGLINKNPKGTNSKDANGNAGPKKRTTRD